MRIFLLDSSYDKSGIYPLKKRDKNYLFNSLRLCEGDTISARDADGSYYEARISGDNCLVLTPSAKPENSLTDSLSGYRGRLPDIHLYQCIAKGKKNEEIARMACEAGVSSVCFVQSRFSQEKTLTSHALERITLIMKEAVQQSGSETVVKTPQVLSFDQAISKAEGKIIMLHQAKGEKSQNLVQILQGMDEKSEISLFTGPEGGFSDEECEKAILAGASLCLLTTNILRCETAAIYATGAIQTILCSSADDGC